MQCEGQEWGSGKGGFVQGDKHRQEVIRSQRPGVEVVEPSQRKWSAKVRSQGVTLLKHCRKKQ